MNLEVHDVCEDARGAAAAALTEAVMRSLERERASKGAADARVTVALSGGSALMAWPLAAAKLGDTMKHVRLTWVDERCVPVADAESNRGSLQRMGAVPPAGELALWLDDESPEQAVARVRAELGRWGSRLDVTLLGMGPDGHIASLFPGRSWDGDLVHFIDDSPKPPPRRMTLTRVLLSTAQSSILLATGESKRAALTALLAGDTRLPAVGLPHLSLYTDLDLTSGSRT